MVCPCRTDDVFFDHNATQVVSAEVETLPTHLDALCQPGDLNVWNVVENYPCHAQPAQLFVSRASVWNLPADLRVVWLQRPGNESDKSSSLLLQLIQPIQVLDAMLECFAQPEHHGRRGWQPKAMGRLHHF